MPKDKGAAAQAVFTPGPWSVRGAVCRNDHPDTSADVHGRDGQFVADCGCHEQATPNATLIAAAPELYAALKAICAAFAYTAPEYLPGSALVAFGKTEAALAKAEGRSAPTAPPASASDSTSEGDDP